MQQGCNSPEFRRVSVAVLTCLLIATAVVLLAADDHAYTGNTNTYKFHRLSCRYAGCKNCTARFKTREEAINAGYRPCGICEP